MASFNDAFTPDEQAKVKQLFDRIDSNHDGNITAAELKKLCAEFGHDLPDDRAKELIAKNDPGKTGSVDFSRFCEAMAAVLVKIKVAVVLVAIFRTLDADGSGFITAVNLNKLIAEHGADIPPAKVTELIKKCDTNGDGQISFKEFIQALVAFLRAQA